MEIGTIGSRLREQREKLGFSQGQLAQKSGVTARSQRNYEMGTRVPDAEYLVAASAAGVDINYVLNGGYGHHDSDEDVVVVMAIEQSFGIAHDDFEKAIDAALVDDEICAYDPNIMFSELQRISVVFRHLVEKEGALDSGLLTQVLEALENSCLNSGKTISPQKKAAAVAMLYRAFKASGIVDGRMVEEAVTLAAG